MDRGATARLRRPAERVHPRLRPCRRRPLAQGAALSLVWLGQPPPSQHDSIFWQHSLHHHAECIQRASRQRTQHVCQSMRRPFVSIRRVVQVGLHRRFCATQPAGYLRDREALLVAVVARERSSLAPFTTRSPAAIAGDDSGCSRRLPNALDSHRWYSDPMSAPRLDPRRSLVAFRGSGGRVVSRITIERFRLSSNSTLMTAGRRAHAQPTRATAPECLPAARVERISKRVRAAPWAPASHPSSRQSGTPS